MGRHVDDDDDDDDDVPFVRSVGFDSASSL
jgi:hypothetical protein